MSLTGDPLTDSLIPAASRLVWAVREGDQDDVENLLDEVRNEGGRVGIDGLLIVLAAMVPDDMTPADLLAWMSDRDEYLRLRSNGVDSRSAGSLALRRKTLDQGAA